LARPGYDFFHFLRGCPLKPDTAIPADNFPNVLEQVAWDSELRMFAKGLNHSVGTKPSRCCVPQGQRCQSVGVDMLWAFDQFRKWSNGIAGLLIARIVYLHEDRSVTLDNERIERIVLHACSMYR
jgi:hypothetical protein